jgi:DNA polymerase-4
MPEKIVLHCDLNNCYASIEMLHDPSLRGHPVAVGGDAEKRHGIILAKNYEAKAFGVQVGMALWEAKQNCPKLIIVPPHYDRYIRFSRMFRKILADYSDAVESFGLDEAWVDITTIAQREGEGGKIADEIRERVKIEMGVTCSIGVSYNKIFAKLGSDMKKPDGTTVITKANYRDVVWTLPAEDILGVGRATHVKLMRHGVKTIGDIARTNPDTLKSWFGKWGLFLYAYANGQDNSSVKATDYEAAVKSVGNSTTCPRDLLNEDDAHLVFFNLAESVAERMRELGLMARTVEIGLRTTDLAWCNRQMVLPRPSMVSGELTDAAMALLRQHFRWEKPLRGIGIRGTNLMPIGAPQQLSLFEDARQRERREKLEYAIDGIRGRFGHYAIGRAVMAKDKMLSELDAKADHVIHPVGYA